VFAILCNFSNENAREVVHKIYDRLATIGDTATLARYIAQLRILGQLRNLHKIVKEEERKMISRLGIDITKDPTFIEALEIGIEKEREKNIIRFYTVLKQPIHLIAENLDLRIDYVKEVLKKNKLI